MGDPIIQCSMPGEHGTCGFLARSPLPSDARGTGHPVGDEEPREPSVTLAEVLLRHRVGAVFGAPEPTELPVFSFC
ncbi:hypothetical protein [Streptomyces sp900105755]|uniref:Uncharacterized protein n=1 Tax=Streptomyces sp. 900105755 TaxID=3154389 RepID=A0ABV1TMG9_9ACTN